MLEGAKEIDKNCTTLIIRLIRQYKIEDLHEMEKELAEKTGKKVILLDSRFGEVIAM